jgi:AcrR family transcriptional regulator
MPPKARYTREEISEAAYEMVRKYGKDLLTARSLAATLETSTAPIFTAFSSIDEVMESVKERAYALYSEYIAEGLLEEIPFKASGLKYIQFAKDEPELFRLLFMGSPEKLPNGDFVPASDGNSSLVQSALEKSWGIDKESAKRIYNHLTIYCHGIAVFIVQQSASFSDEDIGRMLSEVFYALKGDTK